MLPEVIKTRGEKIPCSTLTDSLVILLSLLLSILPVAWEMELFW